MRLVARAEEAAEPEARGELGPVPLGPGPRGRVVRLARGREQPLPLRLHVRRHVDRDHQLRDAAGLRLPALEAEVQPRRRPRERSRDVLRLAAQERGQPRRRPRLPVERRVLEPEEDVLRALVDVVRKCALRLRPIRLDFVGAPARVRDGARGVRRRAHRADQRRVVRRERVHGGVLHAQVGRGRLLLPPHVRVLLHPLAPPTLRAGLTRVHVRRGHAERPKQVRVPPHARLDHRGPRPCRSRPCSIAPLPLGGGGLVCQIFHRRPRRRDRVLQYGRRGITLVRARHCAHTPPAPIPQATPSQAA